MISNEQRAHDLAILYMQTHTDHWKEPDGYNKFWIMYQKLYSDFFERLKHS